MNEAIYTSTSKNDYVVYNNRIALGNVVIARSAITKLVWIEPDKSFPGTLQIFVGGSPISIQIMYDSKQDFLNFKNAIESILI